MPGPLPKPTGRQHHGVRPSLELRLPQKNKKKGSVQAPAPPSGLLKATREQWRVYWGSPLAAACERGTDLPGLIRLFTLYDERERAYRGYRKARVVSGASGQPVLNPLGRIMLQLDGEIRQLEDRFGLSQRARLQLGITMGTLRPQSDDVDERAPEEDHEDPRVSGAS